MSTGFRPLVIAALGVACLVIADACNRDLTAPRTREASSPTVALASPIKRQLYGLDGMILGMHMHHDILLALGVKNDSPKTDDDRSLLADSLINAAPNDSTRQALALSWGVRIHEVNYNYLKYPASIDSVRGYLRTIRHSCLP